MSSDTYHDWLASILKKAQGHLTDSGREIDVGRECVMLRVEIEQLRKERDEARQFAVAWSIAGCPPYPW